MSTFVNTLLLSKSDIMQYIGSILVYLMTFLLKIWKNGVGRNMFFIFFWKYWKSTWFLQHYPQYTRCPKKNLTLRICNNFFNIWVGTTKSEHNNLEHVHAIGLNGFFSISKGNFFIVSWKNIFLSWDAPKSRENRNSQKWLFTIISNLIYKNPFKYVNL